jgi:hypothetical protein
MLMGQGSSDAVLEPVRVCRHKLAFRLGVEFRIANRTPPPPESLLDARYFRLQVASPPPGRVDGSDWWCGLRVIDGTGNGREFTKADSSWRDTGVFPLGGISSLGQPQPDTLVLDRWLAVPAVRPSTAPATTFILTAPDEPSIGPTNYFLSAPYPPPAIAGKRLSLAGVNYYGEWDLPLTGAVTEWIAISLDVFSPPDRFSVDYIVAVEQSCPHEPNQHTEEQPPSFPIVKSW